MILNIDYKLSLEYKEVFTGIYFADTIFLWVLGPWKSPFPACISAKYIYIYIWYIGMNRFFSTAVRSGLYQVLVFGSWSINDRSYLEVYCIECNVFLLWPARLSRSAWSLLFIILTCYITTYPYVVQDTQSNCYREFFVWKVSIYLFRRQRMWMGLVHQITSFISARHNRPRRG